MAFGFGTSVKVAAIGLAMGLIIAPLPSTNLAFAAEGPKSVSGLAKRLLPSVVNISTTTKAGPRAGRRLPLPDFPQGSPFEQFEEFFGRPNEEEGEEPEGRARPSASGSGFVIDAKEGIVITNNHVIESADEITVNFSDGSKLIAELVGTDPKTDIAVLKVTPSDDIELKEVDFGGSEEMEIGDWVMAIGNPFGLGGTVTMGIISARNRDINAGPYDNFIQTDASINRGNSGGPLFNMDGEVIGINTAIISPSGGSIGIGFAIPSDLATNVIAQLREFGETRRGWLGVSIQPVTVDIAESLGMKEAEGALIAGVTADGPAEASKIEPGDVVVEFDGQRIKDWRDLPRVVADTPVGETVDVTVFRNEKEQTISVELGRLEDGEKLIASQRKASSETEKALELLGMGFVALDDVSREKFSIAESVENGVVISDVKAGSMAADKGVEPGSVVLEIGQVEVNEPKDIEERIEATRKAERKNALFLIAAPNGDLSLVVIRLN